MAIYNSYGILYSSASIIMSLYTDLKELIQDCKCSVAKEISEI